MKVVVQRSGKACVRVSGKMISQISEGLVLLVGFCCEDTLDKIPNFVKKIVNLRIFPDENDIMNKSILEYGGEVLSISQFTLYGECERGNRPSYFRAMKNEEAIKFYEYFNGELEKYVSVSKGIFGADMEVEFTNIGPTTILLER